MVVQFKTLQDTMTRHIGGRLRKGNRRIILWLALPGGSHLTAR